MPVEGRASPFDGGPMAEEDLWFLPQHDDADPDAGFSPLPRADRRPLFDPAEWRRAQGDLSGELASLALRFGALDARLSVLGEGVRQRLALREAAEISWWTGGRIGVERLTLWLGLRLGGGDADGQALSQAGWAMRRLMAGHPLAKDGWRAGMQAFLGRTRADDGIDEVAEVMAPMAALHPVTQSAVLFHAWRLAGQGAARDVEAAAMAACHGAGMATGHARFLPLTGTGALALRASGSAHARLSAWIEGADQATRAALAELDRLAQWQVTATGALADLNGRTPQALVALLAAWPMVTAPLAEARTGASRAAVQRNLLEMEARGLIREITGQGRYRVWMPLMKGSVG